jgi:hypothetical protein
MKKHLSLLCLLALLAAPMVGCKKEEPMEVEDTTATTMETTTDTTMATDTMTTDTMATDMGTDMGMGTEPTGTNMEPPPAQ